MSTYDAIVLGVGGVGSAALLNLAEQGLKVVGVDRFDPPHDRGSSHGQTRVIRQAYFEHPDYVPLVLKSFRLWQELEESIGRKLYHETGLIEVGPPDGIVVPGVAKAAAAHGLDIQRLDACEIEKRWQGLKVPGEMTGIFEQRAGYLLVEDCVEGHINVAKQLGAELLTGCEVLNWTATSSGVTVTTTSEMVSAGALVIAVGAWSGQLLHDLGIPLSVLSAPLFWFRCVERAYEEKAGMPVFLFERPEGIFYGFPSIEPGCIKVAEHSGKQVVNNPLTLDRSMHDEDHARLVTFLSAHLPGVGHEVTSHAACMYTMTPDEHFVVDQHPEHKNVTFAAGLSGHGFKFTPVLGKALADLVTAGATDYPAEFLSVNRFV